MTAGAVSAASDRDLEVAFPGVADGRGDVGLTRRADEQRGSPVEHRVPDASCVLVGLVTRRDDLAGKSIDRLGHARQGMPGRASTAPEAPMWGNWRHRIATSNAEPTNPNQNGAVIPNCRASRPPIGVPMTIPPKIATV